MERPRTNVDGDEDEENQEQEKAGCRGSHSEELHPQLSLAQPGPRGCWKRRVAMGIVAAPPPPFPYGTARLLRENRSARAVAVARLSPPPTPPRPRFLPAPTSHSWKAEIREPREVRIASTSHAVPGG
jgi:hypothetical protein